MLPSALLALLVAAADPVGVVAAIGPTPPGRPAAPIPVLAPAWLDLVVNGVPKGTFLVQLSGSDAWVAAEDLEAAGLTIPGGERLERSGRSLVSLASLAPAVTFTVDEPGLAVRLVAAQAVLGRSRLDLARGQRPAELLHREAASAYLNWALAGDSEEHRSASTELGVAVGPGLLLGGATWDDRNGPVRGLTTGYWDDRPRLVRWAVGDVVYSPADALGGNGLVLGGSVGREFSLDPYLLRAPSPRTTIFSPTPATLEVWVDQGLVRRTQVLPGTIDLENIPVNAGFSEIRTVLRDPFGREVTASTFALLGSSSLAPGLVDWGVAAGARRESFGTRSFDYAGPLGQARLRAGVTDHLTLGGRLEGGDGLVSGGGSIVVVTRFAELELTGAGSLDGSDPGAATWVAIRHLELRGGAAAQLRWDSGRYANGSLPASADRPLERAQLSGWWQLTPRLSALADLASERRRDAGRDGRGVVRLSLALPGGFLAALSAGRTLRSGAPDSSDVLLTLSMFLPGGATAEVDAATGSRGAPRFAQASVTRSLPPGPGIGYRLAARGGDGAMADGELRGQNRLGRAELVHTEVEPWSGARTAYTSAQVSSGLVLIGGGLHVTRPIDGSYALVKVDDAPGVQVLLQNQDMGRTDRSGELLVPGLQPYLGNRIAIRDSDLPLDYRVDEVERVVAPTQRGGTVERFRVARQLAVSGRLLLDVDGKDVPPEWGEVAVELPGRRASSPVGHGGAFWLEMVPPGRHDALIRWEGRLCRFAFEVPPGAAGVVDLGEIRCTQSL